MQPVLGIGAQGHHQIVLHDGGHRLLDVREGELREHAEWQLRHVLHMCSRTGPNRVVEVRSYVEHGVYELCEGQLCQEQKVHAMQPVLGIRP